MHTPNPPQTLTGLLHKPFCRSACSPRYLKHTYNDESTYTYSRCSHAPASLPHPHPSPLLAPASCWSSGVRWASVSGATWSNTSTQTNHPDCHLAIHMSMSMSISNHTIKRPPCHPFLVPRHLHVHTQTCICTVAYTHTQPHTLTHIDTHTRPIPSDVQSSNVGRTRQVGGGGELGGGASLLGAGAIDRRAGGGG